MPNPSTVADLSTKLKARTEANRAEIEKIVSESLTALTASLQRSAKKELSTINRGIQSQAQQIEQTLSQALQQIESQAQNLRKTRRVWPWVLGSTIVSLNLIFLGALGSQYLVTQWTEKDLADKQAAIQRMNQALATANNWGVTFLEDQTGRYIILPDGLQFHTGYTVEKNQQAAKITR